MDVINREALVERFGEWPSFHDAEVYALRLDSGQGTDGVLRLELDVHVFDVDGTLPDGRFNFVRHTLVTLVFEEVEAMSSTASALRTCLTPWFLRKCSSLLGNRFRSPCPPTTVSTRPSAAAR